MDKTTRFFVGDKTLGDLMPEDRMIEPPPVRRRIQRERNPSHPGIKIKEVNSNDPSSSVPMLAITDKGKRKIVEENSMSITLVILDNRQSSANSEMIKAISKISSEPIQARQSRINDGGYERNLRLNPNRRAFTNCLSSQELERRKQIAVIIIIIF